jgi:hypothetical protein
LAVSPDAVVGYDTWVVIADGSKLDNFTRHRNTIEPFSCAVDEPEGGLDDPA